eukprot:8957030-Lingulodinium_polyedra.AAC.1
MHSARRAPRPPALGTSRSRADRAAGCKAEGQLRVTGACWQGPRGLGEGSRVPAGASERRPPGCGESQMLCRGLLAFPAA